MGLFEEFQSFVKPTPSSSLPSSMVSGDGHIWRAEEEQAHTELAFALGEWHPYVTRCSNVFRWSYMDVHSLIFLPCKNKH